MVDNIDRTGHPGNTICALRSGDSVVFICKYCDVDVDVDVDVMM